LFSISLKKWQLRCWLIENNSQTNPPNFLNVRRPASALNTFDDPQDIADTEAADVLNMVFDRGYPQPRKGSFLAYSKPTGETNNLLNTIVFTTSNRLEYLVAIYAPNFYVYDSVNSLFVPINGGYTPSSANNTLPYGYTSWNNGVGDDRGYMGNGTDPTIRWTMALDHTSQSQSSSDTSITLNSVVQFPKTGGTVSIQVTGGFINATYTSITGNTLALTAALGTAVGTGASVAICIQNMSGNWTGASTFLNLTTQASDTTITLLDGSKFAGSGNISIYNGTTITPIAYSSISGNVLTIADSGTVGAVIPLGAPVVFNNTGVITVPPGKIFAKFQGRMIVGNSINMETTMFYSNVGNPEDFSIAGTPSGGGYYGFTQGIGQITGLFDFGQYIGVLKGDGLQHFEFSIDATQSTKIDIVTPLISDSAMGCPYFHAWIKKNNTVYWPSTSSGIMSVSPLITGFQTSIQLAILSQKIQNLYQALDFTNSKVMDFQTKVLWSCSSTAGGVQDTILVYDTLRQYWTRFNNWPVQDWFKMGSKLYFGSYQDGNIYVCFDDSMTDNGNGYTAYTYTKRYDAGNAALPKTQTYLYVQAQLNTSTKLYCDILFNDQGSQQIITYLIDGSQIYVNQPITPAMGMVMMGVPLLEDVSPVSLNTMGLAKIYLPIPIKYGTYNIQYKFYTQDGGANWGLTGIAFNPRMEIKHPAELVINTDGTIQGSIFGGVAPTAGAGLNLISATQMLTGVQSGNNITLDLGLLSHSPYSILFITMDGQTLDQTRWTQSGLTITVTSAYFGSSYQVFYTYSV
jgi:hypothetical protein